MNRTFVASWRYVDTELDRPRWRGTLNYRALPTLLLGVELNVAADEIGPLFTWFLNTESHGRPAVFLGTSSDRIGSPAGKQSYYMTLAKTAPWFPVSAYATLNYSEWDEGMNIPFGCTAWLGDHLSVQPMYDGQRTHLMASYASGGFGVSLLLIWLDTPGLSVSFGL